jgi:hypothetical protein
MTELLTWPVEFVDRNPAVVWTLAGVSVASLVLVAMLLPGMVARLPADYFSPSRRQLHRQTASFGWTKSIGRNLLGIVFVLAGLAMLLLPGQGLLTLLIGMFLVDFPGKRAVERAVVRREGIRKVLDRMRTKRGQPPLELD